jgi:hypothetical protein
MKEKWISDKTVGNIAAGAACFFYFYDHHRIAAAKVS